MAKFCTNCGAQLDENVKFCGVCGEKQDAAPEKPQQPAPVPVPEPVPAPVTAPVQQPVQTNAPAVTVKPQKKRLVPLPVKIIIILLVVMIVISALTVAGIFGTIYFILGNAAKEDYYKLGDDQIPSVRLVLGENRKVTGSATEKSGDVTKRTIEYKVDGTEQKREMQKYYTYLSEKDGFLNLTDINFEKSSGKCVVGRNSVDKGYEIQLQISYSESGYTITILKQPGAITVLNQNELTDNENNPTEANTIEDPGYPPDVPMSAEWVGVWSYYAEDTNVEIYNFADDGKFIHRIYYGGMLIAEISGNYEISDGNILLSNIYYFDEPGEWGDESYTFSIYHDTITIGHNYYSRAPLYDEASIWNDPYEYFQIVVDDDMWGIWDYYEIVNDSITSIETVVGRRDMISYDTDFVDGNTVTTIVYETDPDDFTQAANDIAAYFQYLLDNDGFVSLVSFSSLPYVGGIELSFAKNAADPGNIIILDIEYDTTGYTLIFTTGEGTLTLFSDDDEIENDNLSWFSGTIQEGQFYHDGRDEWLAFYYVDVGSSQFKALKEGLGDGFYLSPSAKTEIMVYSASDDINISDYIGRDTAFKGFWFEAETVYHQRPIVFGIQEIY